MDDFVSRAPGNIAANEFAVHADTFAAYFKIFYLSMCNCFKGFLLQSSLFSRKC